MPALQLCTPHVTQNPGLTETGRRRCSAIDGRTTRHTGYANSQSRRAMQCDQEVQVVRVRGLFPVVDWAATTAFGVTSYSC